jgi:hypothetical protein
LKSNPPNKSDKTKNKIGLKINKRHFILKVRRHLRRIKIEEKIVNKIKKSSDKQINKWLTFNLLKEFWFKIGNFYNTTFYLKQEKIDGFPENIKTVSFGPKYIQSENDDSYNEIPWCALWYS